MQNKTHSKISVIIPVYNAELYLERCLNSVCNQTLKDIEILCIDDCSKDNSLNILEKYAQKDKRVKIFQHKTNGGESKARNTGLENATGEYLAFVDNDDTVDLDFLEKLYLFAQKQNLDIAKGNSKEIDYNGKEKNNNNNAILKLYNNEKMMFTTHWWSAIYKRELILNNNITFPENVILGGDIIFLNKALISVKRFNVIDNVFYIHHLRENSGDSKILSEKKIKSAIYSYTEIIRNLNKNCDNISNIGYGYAAAYYLGGIYSRFFHNNQDNIKKICANSVLDCYKETKKNIELSNFLLEIIPQVYYFLLNSDVEGLFEMMGREPLKFIDLIRYRHRIKFEEQK